MKEYGKPYQTGPRIQAYNPIREYLVYGLAWMICSRVIPNLITYIIQVVSRAVSYQCLTQENAVKTATAPALQQSSLPEPVEFHRAGVRALAAAQPSLS